MHAHNTKNAAWISAKSAEEAKHDFDISLEQTGAGYFDFYLIHNTGGNRTAVFDKFNLWDFVKQLKAEGKVRHIGFSHHDNAETLDELLTAHPEMEFVQLQINYADWENANVQSRKCAEVCLRHGRHWYGFSTSAGHHASDCIQCGQCEDACPQHIEIVSKLEKAANLFDD